HAIFVDCFEVVVRGCVPELLLGPHSLPVADGDRACQLRPHAPLRDVRMMAAPVGDLPAGVAENPAEVHETAAWSIRCFGRGSEPEIVIEAVRNRLRLLPVAGLTIIRRTAWK